MWFINWIYLLLTYFMYMSVRFACDVCYFSCACRSVRMVASSLESDIDHMWPNIISTSKTKDWIWAINLNQAERLWCDWSLSDIMSGSVHLDNDGQISLPVATVHWVDWWTDQSKIHLSGHSSHSLSHRAGLMLKRLVMAKHTPPGG